MRRHNFVLAVLVLALAQFLALPARALAADNPFQRGPDPTSASVNAARARSRPRRRRCPGCR